MDWSLVGASADVEMEKGNVLFVHFVREKIARSSFVSFATRDPATAVRDGSMAC